MKIKQVCEQTGLTDSAIRYYIDEGLVSPSYSENYMGRRAYDFNEADVTALNHVATLRKFGFTVEEIRRILTDPQESVGIVAEVRARKEETLRQEGENLDALSRLEEARAYTVAELAEKLAEPVREVEVPKEDGRKAWRALAGRIAWAAVLLVVGALPVCWLLGGTLAGLRRCYYPVIRPSVYAVDAVIILLPTIVLALMWLMKKRRPGHGTWRTYVTVALCTLYLPVSLWGSVFLICESETDRIQDYRQLDVRCELNNDALFQALFPADGWWSGAISAYYYRYDAVLFPNYDVYAEICLPPDELAAEAARVEALFAPVDSYTRFAQGDFVCMAWSPDGPVNTLTAKSEHHVMAFAYNMKTGQARYMAYYGGQEPYYMALDW